MPGGAYGHISGKHDTLGNIQSKIISLELVPLTICIGSHQLLDFFVKIAIN